jgi:hypothetical protein
VKFIRNAILRWARGRAPDFVIGGHERPYLRRHWLLPRNRFLNVYVHEFMRSDDDRALHDHPWAFNCSILLQGKYIEWVPSNGNAQRALPKFRSPGQTLFRWGGAPHRIQLYRAGERETPCWTLFITGPRVREWGFYCPQGWMHWKRFTAADDPGSIGRGCDA